MGYRKYRFRQSINWYPTSCKRCSERVSKNVGNLFCIKFCIKRTVNCTLYIDMNFPLVLKEWNRESMLMSNSLVKKAVLSKLKLQKFYLNTHPCLPKPMQTDVRTIIILSIILVIVLLSCIFDAYALRLREQICNSC